MSLNKEELIKKIIYRSSYRGSKEMDNLMSSFVKSVITKWTGQFKISQPHLTQYCIIK